MGQRREGARGTSQLCGGSDQLASRLRGQQYIANSCLFIVCCLWCVYMYSPLVVIFDTNWEL